MDNLYLCHFFATFVKVSKSVTGRKLQHIRGELFGVIGAEAFGKILIRHYKIFCVNGNTGFRNESRIFYFIHLQNEEAYERKESSSA